MSTENPKRPPVEALEAKRAAIDEHKHDPLGGVGDCEHCDAMDVYELALRNAAPDLFAYICSLEARLAQPLPDDYDVAKLVRWVEGIEFRSKTPQMIEWYPQVKLMANTLTALSRRNAELERALKDVQSGCEDVCSLIGENDLQRAHLTLHQIRDDIDALLAQGDK